MLHWQVSKGSHDEMTLDNPGRVLPSICSHLLPCYCDLAHSKAATLQSTHEMCPAPWPKSYSRDIRPVPVLLRFSCSSTYSL